jgi:hypothetical protein
VIPNSIWLVSLQALEVWAQRETQTEDVQTEGECHVNMKTATDKAGRESWNRTRTHSPQKKLIPWLQTSSCEIQETIIFCCWSHPVCGTFLWYAYQLTKLNTLFSFSSFISTPTLLSSHCTPAVLNFLHPLNMVYPFLSRPLHRLNPVPGMFFSQLFACLTPLSLISWLSVSFSGACFLFSLPPWLHYMPFW